MIHVNCGCNSVATVVSEIAVTGIFLTIVRLGVVVKKSKLYEHIDNVEKYLCIIALSIMLIIVFWQVVSRYLFGSANSWSEELARALNVFVVYISCSYGIRFKDHIKIDVMIKVFPGVVRPYISFIGELLMLIFFVVLMIKGFQLAVSVFSVGRTTSGIGMNAGLLYFIPPIGFSLSTIRLSENWADSLLHVIRNKSLKNSGQVTERGAK